MFLYYPPYAKRTFTMILSRPCISYILQWQLLYFLSNVVFQSKLPEKSPRTRQITTPSPVSRHGHRSAGAAAMAQSPRQRRRAQQRGGRAALHRDATPAVKPCSVYIIDLLCSVGSKVLSSLAVSCPHYI